jgi:hypothetical protein
LFNFSRSSCHHARGWSLATYFLLLPCWLLRFSRE